ncbi:hypothetical protein ACR8AL_15500 [Clavibacter sepedonicus]|uniref:Membrane protein n=1 Tax=Clavibacter sepedonicus TaxID=31964 RepID=B0RCG1_CLASE|nr:MULTISPECIES: hypothetical protein [Clavibacter]OQJ48970.1 hypothetical protein B5P19_12510 [Clavibacter sepedonicus]OQJ53719.1 hypothetical protein B5P20_05940 [Clavibacter sepedonicus]UUK65154.1 hypothetical protein LRE50_12830 [Clavibacter sepedonicus]CAQ00560.1 putative membrane protein [Clavibacter sepedonicus]
MNTADPTLDTRIQAFAAAVRARLADLDAEDVDDLTGGLEADLQEEAADHDGALELGDPVRYADELRSSAGLPERAVAAAPLSPIAQMRESMRARGRDVHARIRANRELSAILDLLILFRPVWWLLRAWAGYLCFVTVIFGGFSVLPRNPAAWVLLIALVVISVQWGRGNWVRSAPARTLKATISVITAASLVVLIPVSIDEMAPRSYAESAYPSSYQQPGLSLDGKALTNLFAYDADGNLLDRVQLFDQDGEPVTTVSSVMDDGRLTDPVTGERMKPADGAWNVFPLERDLLATSDGATATGSGAVRPPFAKALPLRAGPGSTPTPTPSPGGATGDAPAATPTATPTPTPEPTP